MKYTTLEKVKNIVPDTTLTDDQINEYIEFVSGYMDTFVGYALARDYSDAPQDMVVDGSGTNTLILNQPINALGSVETIFGVSSVLPADYIVSYPLNEPYTTHIGIRIGKFQAGMGNYVLKDVRKGRYTIDFVTSSNHTLPADLVQVATNLSAEIVKNNAIQSSANTGVVASETTGSYSVSYVAPTKELVESILSSTPNVQTILKSYKQISIS